MLILVVKVTLPLNKSGFQSSAMSSSLFLFEVFSIIITAPCYLN